MNPRKPSTSPRGQPIRTDRATESPWDSQAQHGGPPTALLGHLLDTAAGPDKRGPHHRRLSRCHPPAPSASTPSRYGQAGGSPSWKHGWSSTTVQQSSPGLGPSKPDRPRLPLGTAPPPALADADPASTSPGGATGKPSNGGTRGGYGTADSAADVWTGPDPLIAGEKLTGLARTLVSRTPPTASPRPCRWSAGCSSAVHHRHPGPLPTPNGCTWPAVPCPRRVGVSRHPEHRRLPREVSQPLLVRPR